MIIGSPYTTEEISFTTCIPLPHDLAAGFIIFSLLNKIKRIK
jgi:hypothetical protein